MRNPATTNFRIFLIDGTEERRLLNGVGGYEVLELVDVFPCFRVYIVEVVHEYCYPASG